jgi:rubrerythrin
MPQQTGLKAADRILAAALAKEESARDFYIRLAAQCRVDFITELLERLRDEESKHVRMVRDMISRLGAGKPVA